MSAIARSTVALFLSASLAAFGVGCVTEETIDDDMEELEADVEDELEQDELEVAEESDEAELEELAKLAEPADRMKGHAPSASHRWIDKRNNHPRTGRLSLEQPEAAEEILHELSDKVRDSSFVGAGGLDPAKLFDKDFTDESIPANAYVTDEILEKLGCEADGGIWASGVCILPPAA